MAPSSCGGTTVGEALNILERFRLRGMSRRDALHHYLEASALAFADRGKYVGDPAYVDVPLRHLLSDRYAAERACEIDPDQAATKPVDAGRRDQLRRSLRRARRAGATTKPDTENVNTTNLTVADRWGNVVEYTLTIEQTGGSGIVVPGRGFLLNNELTDFTAVYDPADPNRIEPGKRPRSSISPTIVLRNGKPVLALGLARRVDDHHDGAADAVQPVRPRDDASSRPSRRRGRRSATPRTSTAEQAFIDSTARPLGASATPSCRPESRAPAPRRSALRRRSSSAAAVS